MARLNVVKSARAPRIEGRGMPRCGRCGTEVQVGESYYWWKNRAPGMRGGVKSVRCKEHRPSPAEMTPGRRGQLLALQESVESTLSGATDPADVIAAAEEAAEGLRELASELQEGAENIEQGFGHPTYQSEEMAEKAQTLESLADEMEGEADDGEYPEEVSDLEEGTYPESAEELNEDFKSEADAEAALEAAQRPALEAAQEAWLEEARDRVTAKLDEAEV